MRIIHLLAAYWGFVLMSIHLGLYWNRVMIFFKQYIVLKKSTRLALYWKIAAMLFSCYGFYAFMKRQLGDYMLLNSEFVFFNFNEAIFFFLLDYLAIMAAFIFTGHWLNKILKSNT